MHFFANKKPSLFFREGSNYIDGYVLYIGISI